jgi:hypothetical protein
MYEAVGSAINAFAAGAASGQVSIRADAARDALTEIGNIRTELENLLGNAGETQVQLGANPVGDAMSGKSMDRYSGGDSFLAVVRKLLLQTEQAERALKQSIDNYVDTDETHASQYRGA